MFLVSSDFFLDYSWFYLFINFYAFFRKKNYQDGGDI